jgi:hypothetical protein
MTESTGKSDGKVAVSRRSLLRGATIIAPTILTLHSGAALARSSNLIGASPNQVAENGKFNCLDTRSVELTNKRNVYDLGDKPMAHVTTIRSNKKYYKVGSDDHQGDDLDRVDGTKMCEEGGWYLRKDDAKFEKVRVHRGVLLSATAMNSFSNDITYTDV